MLAYHRKLILFSEKMFKGSRMEFRNAAASLLQENRWDGSQEGSPQLASMRKGNEGVLF